MEERRDFRRFLITISLTVAIFMFGIYIGAAIRTRTLMQEEILSRARANFNLIVLTRKWNSIHGGVFVEKKKGVTSNPFLENPDIRTDDGVVYTKKNPALMTREISELAENDGIVKFHITSLKPLNPRNSPDSFEMTALKAFEQGKAEHFEETTVNKRRHFRYIAPLKVEQSCLQCHSKQGYKIGDIRGGISVTLDIEHIHTEMKKNIYFIMALSIISIAALLFAIYLFTTRLIKRIVESRKKIEELIMFDELTGIFNRRHTFMRFHEEFSKARRQKKDLSCVMIDLDHFKQVNDTYGHHAGDIVLNGFAKFLQKFIRAYDILGRIGGEEFLIVLPDTSFGNARQFSERLREHIEKNLAIQYESITIRITVSLGISCMSEDDDSLDDIMKRADQGLYKAKNEGRNRVGWVESSFHS
jgi:diguanylate cyclase (GGDEF)-like protein